MQKIASHKYWPYLLLSAVCLIFYVNTLQNQYALDDNYVIDGNERIADGLDNIPKLLTMKYVVDDQQAYGYRPVVMLVFAIEHALFGENPFVSHLINLLIYIITCCLLFSLFRLYFSNYPPWVALTAALFFTVLPLHSEVVNNVKSRDELLAVLFAVLALKHTISLSRKRDYKQLLWIILFIALSLLSKLSTLALIPVILLYLAVHKKWKLAGISAIVFVVAGLGIRYLVRLGQKGAKNLRMLEFIENPLATEQYGLLDRIPIGLGIMWDYLRLLLFPDKLISYYGYNAVPFDNWSSPEVYAMILVIAVSIYIFVRCLKNQPIISFAIGFFLGSLFAISNILKPIIGIIGERFAYFPSIAFSMLVVLGLYYLAKAILSRTSNSERKTLTAPTVLLGLIGLYAIYSLAIIWPRNTEWKDRTTLFKADVTKMPSSVKLNMLYADNLIYDMSKRANVNANIAKEAQRYYKQALEVAPDYGQAYENLSVAQAIAGEKESSVETMLAGRSGGKRVQPQSVNIAKELIQEGNLSSAANLLEAYIEDYGPEAEAYAILIQIYRDMAEYDKSYQTAINGILAIPSAKNMFFRYGQLTATAEGERFKWADLLLEKGLVDTQQYDKIRTTIQKAYDRRATESN